jgi:protease-4
MKLRIGAVLLLVSVCLGAATTQPASKVAPAASRENPLPKPGDILKKIKELQAKQDQATKVAFFDLSHPVVEKPADFSLFGGDTVTTTVQGLIDRMHQARDDKEVQAVLITLGDSGLGLAQAQEIRASLDEIRHKGKRTFVYADSYDTVDYVLACGATDICLMQGGDIMIPGVGVEPTFYKGLFDKLGVKADYVQIGEYKGADESYTRTGASEELKGELKKLTSALYDQIVDQISLGRNLPRSTVVQLVDETIIPAPAAKDRGLVDHLIDQDGLRDMLADELGNDVDLLHDYGMAPRQQVDLSSPLAFLQLLNHQPAADDKPEIGIIYAAGVITDGDGGTSLFDESEGVGSETLRQAFRIAGRDDNVKAVVLRIDSPGGSALASEVMWQAARRFAEKKPLIVSVGGMAASGGYYLASSGDRIFADPAAIVGSIGVVGGKFVYHDLYDKLGLTTEKFSRGANAGLFSSNEPFTEKQRRMVTNWMRGTYDQFTQRVMTTRSGKIQDIDQVARGRIFTATQARALGMVDDIGGIDDAIAYAAKRSGLGAGKYDVRIVPRPRSLADLLGMNGGAEAATAIRPTVQINPILQALPESARRMLIQQVQQMRLMESHPVVLLAPFNVTVN